MKEYSNYESFEYLEKIEKKIYNFNQNQILQIEEIEKKIEFCKFHKFELQAKALEITHLALKNEILEFHYQFKTIIESVKKAKKEGRIL